MLIDDQMSQWEQRVVRAEPVDAPPAGTYAAIRRVDFFDSLMVTVPNRARVLPSDLLRRVRRLPRRSHPQHFTFDQLLQNGFQVVAEEPGHELVLGFIGRFWQRDLGWAEWSEEEFQTFDEPGYAVGAWGLSVLSYGKGSVLVTEVRVRGTDGESRRALRRYAKVPFIRAMERPALRLVRREAERAPTDGA